MCLIRFVILFTLTKEITTELSSYDGVGSGHGMTRCSRNNLCCLVLLTANKQTLTSASVLCSGTASLNTFHTMLVPRWHESRHHVSSNVPFPEHAQRPAKLLIHY